jgi:hypothetical protein
MTAADFLAEYPEFASIDTDPAIASAIITRAIADADAWLSASAFGTLRDKALKLYTAHRLAVRYRATIAQVSTEPVTDAAQTWRADFTRTNYGSEYLTLLDAVTPHGQVCGSAS